MQSGYLSKDDTGAEYRAEAENWELAPGWEWPGVLGYTGVGPDGTGVAYYERGTGRVDATYYWYCSWGRAALHASTARDEAVAIDKLLNLTETPYYLLGLVFEEDRLYVDRIVEGLATGDLTRLAIDVEANCPPHPR